MVVQRSYSAVEKKILNNSVGTSKCGEQMAQIKDFYYILFIAVILY